MRRFFGTLISMRAPNIARVLPQKRWHGRQWLNRGRKLFLTRLA